MGIFDRFFGSPSKDRFARMLKDAIVKAGEKKAIRYNPEAFTLTSGEGKDENTLYLTTAYTEYCGASKAQKPTVFRNFVHTWFVPQKDLPEEFESAKHDLLPAVRSRMMFEHTGLQMKIAGKTGFDWPYRPLAEFLGIGLVYDLPASMMQLQQHMLNQWQATFEEAYESACENLLAITKHTLQEVIPGVWASAWKDNYDPSRMLIIGYIRDHEVKGDPVVMVPNRDTLLLTGSDDPAGLGKMVEIAEGAYEHPRPLSSLAYRLTQQNEWVPFLPEPNHREYKRFRLLQLKNFGSEYSEQQAALNELHEQTGKDIFVASFSAIENNTTGELRSYCVWSEGVVALLPKTDYVYFFRAGDGQDGKIVATVPWTEVETVLGDEFKPVGIYPERYLVKGFPTNEQIAGFGIQ